MTPSREQALEALRNYRTSYYEADQFSKTVDARMWEGMLEEAEAVAEEAGLSRAEIEEALTG